MSIEKLRTLILRKPFVGAFLLAVAVNLPMFFFAPPIGGSQHDGYLELAQNMARGHGYVFEPGGPKVFHRPPLYATLLTPGMVLPRVVWPIYVIILNSALFAAAAALLAWAVRSCLGEQPAFWAWAIFVLNPFVLYTIKNPMPPHAQTLAYLAISVLGLKFAHKLWRGESISALALLLYAAVLFAGSMSHGTMLMNAALWLLLLGGIAAFRRQMHSVMRIGACGVCLAALIAPWTWRNYIVTGLFLPVAGNVGVAYFAGNAHWGITAPPRAVDESNAQALFRHANLPAETRLEYFGLVDPEVEKTMNAKVSMHAKSNPMAFVRKCVLNGAEYFFPITYFLLMKRGLPVEPLAISLYFALLLAAAAIGFGKLFKGKETRMIAVSLAVFTLGYAVPYWPFLTFVGHSLYSFGTLPYLAVLAAAAIHRPAH